MKTENEVTALESKLAETEAKLRETSDQILRIKAEFDNSRKRLERDKLEAIKFANERLLAEILPAMDNLDRALASIADDHGGVTRFGVARQLAEQSYSLGDVPHVRGDVLGVQVAAVRPGEHQPVELHWPSVLIGQGAVVPCRSEQFALRVLGQPMRQL